MYRTQDLRDALLQVDNYVDYITEKVAKIKDLSESRSGDSTREELEVLLDGICDLSEDCLSTIE